MIFLKIIFYRILVSVNLRYVI